MSFLEVRQTKVSPAGALIKQPARLLVDYGLPVREVNLNDLRAFLKQPKAQSHLVSALTDPDPRLPIKTLSALAKIAEDLPVAFIPDIAAATLRGTIIQLADKSKSKADNSNFLEQVSAGIKELIAKSNHRESKSAVRMAYHAISALVWNDVDCVEDELAARILNPSRSDGVLPMHNLTNWLIEHSDEQRRNFYKTIHRNADATPESILQLAMLEPREELTAKILNKFYRYYEEETEKPFVPVALTVVFSRFPDLQDKFAPNAASLGSHTLAAVFSEYFTEHSSVASKTIINLSKSAPELITSDGLVILVETAKDPQTPASLRRQSLQVIADNFDKLDSESAEQLISELAYTLHNKDEVDMVVSQLSADLLVRIISKFPEINLDIDETLLYAIPDIINLTYYSESAEKMMPILSQEILTLLCARQPDWAELAAQIKPTLGTEMVKDIISIRQSHTFEYNKIIADLQMAGAIVEALPKILEKFNQDQEMAHQLEGSMPAITAFQSEGKLLKLISLMNDYVLGMYQEAAHHLALTLDQALSEAEKQYPEHFGVSTQQPPSALATFYQVLRESARNAALAA